MTVENIRVNELAKELHLTSKEVLDKFAKLSIPVKAHSSTVTVDQVQRLKDYINAGSKIEIKKPKAFIVKKIKVEAPPEVTEAPAQEPTEQPRVLLERPVRATVETAATPEPQAPAAKATAEEKTEKTEVVAEETTEKPKIEVVRQAPSRLEIVRRAPVRPPVEARPPYQGNRPAGQGDRPGYQGQRPAPQGDRPGYQGQRPAPQGDRPGYQGQRPPYQGNRPSPQGPRPEGAPAGESGDRKPVQRHIISQDIYDNKGGIKRKIGDKGKGKPFVSKAEEQERISLEKAAAQKHKKRGQKDGDVEQVTKLFVNRSLTVSELSEKIQKTPAEIVKFLMMQGIMATVNQLIDIETIKKVCA